MKLPLKWGLLALVGLWVLHGALESPRERIVLLIAAMGVALWTAFSLNIPPKPKPEEESLLDPPEEEERDESDSDLNTEEKKERLE